MSSKAFLLLLAILPVTIRLFAQPPAVVSGTITRLENFQSKYVTARHVDIWLPDNYHPKKKYNVLYMHDGQMLFDAAATWNKQAWDVDDVVSKLASKNKIKDLIVVGIWNGGNTRHSDYFPQKPFESLTAAQRDSIFKAFRANGAPIFFEEKVNSDNYLKFIVHELKPYIDKKYSTHKGRAHTFIAGSSMGGLISMYAICEYPKKFGGAACLSTHWPGIFASENNPIPDAFVAYLRAHLPNPKTHKIYFDYGTATLDAMYPPLQKKVDEVMIAKGFTAGNWITREFPGEDHSETAWKKRLDIPLLFLLGK
ncbi:MAG: alpha/beta hydrolase [Saprospiraceae bacterium]|jgi:predicted alpha/beta superfamily hydrolase|nr:alpha/beta hydrolase [Saprospiraceae bacterium]